MTLAASQSADIGTQLLNHGITVIAGRAELVDDVAGMAHHRVKVTTPDGKAGVLKADVVLIATGAAAGAAQRGARRRTHPDLASGYDLTELPEHLVIVGSGVTGAEFCNAYTELGVTCTVVASRDQILPHEDSDAAAALEEVFAERGVTLVKNARADSVVRTDTGIRVNLADGRTVDASHALMSIGSVPNTAGLGLERVGVELKPGGYIPVDRVSRTPAAGIYAAGDCTGLFPLASVAAMQGRIAMYHALGEGVSPIRLRTVASATFTRPEIGAVGIPQAAIDDGSVPARTLMLPLSTNARAKMSLLRHGFVKIFCRPATGVVIGGGGRSDRLGAHPADRAGGAEPDLGDRSGADPVGVPVTVGVDRRGRPPPDGARRPGLTAPARVRVPSPRRRRPACAHTRAGHPHRHHVAWRTDE